MTAGDQHAGLSPALVEAAAGLTAGSMATLVVHPLDIVKTRMQIHRAGTGEAGVAVPRPSTATVLRSLLQAPHPVAALYRGLAPNLLGNGTSWAAFFFFKARTERLLVAFKNKGRGMDPGGAARLTPADYFVASGLAGVCVQVLTNPLWVLKTRMLSSDLGTAGAYPSMVEGARRVLQTEGIRGFYRGLGVSLLGVSHGAVQFAVYDPVKRLYWAQQQRRRRQRRQRRQADTDADGDGDAVDPHRMTNEATLVISTVAKLAAGAATYPYQVVRSRLQNYDAEARFGRGIRGVATQLWQEDGIRGFYRGLVPSVVRVLPATWVTFLVYENTKHYLPRWFA